MPDVQSSSLMSHITADSSEIPHDDASSVLDHGASATEWTNEKHCLYIRSMEELFVNQLHCSMGLLRGCTPEKISFEQCKSIRDGTNTWIRRFRKIRKNQTEEATIHSCRQSTMVSRRDLVDDITEMSGQNFVDNSKSMKSCSARLAKRKQMEANTNAYSDQVVPRDMPSASECNRKALKRQC